MNLYILQSFIVKMNYAKIHAKYVVIKNIIR